jgi:hypothetical protein
MKAGKTKNIITIFGDLPERQAKAPYRFITGALGAESLLLRSKLRSKSGL